LFALMSLGGDTKTILPPRHGGTKKVKILFMVLNQKTIYLHFRFS